MAQANPGQTLSNVSAAGAGTSIDFMGAAAGSFSTTTGVPFAVPGRISMHVEISGYTATGQIADVVPQNPYVNVGLEVSLDGTNWLRVGAVQGNGNTPANRALSVQVQYPARFARAFIDTLDTRITAVTVNAWVAGSAG